MWRAGRDYWSPWELQLTLYVVQVLHVEGWAGVGTLVSAVAICRAVCHEELDETWRGDNEDDDEGWI